MSLADLPLNYVDERNSTGRAWLHGTGPRPVTVKIQSTFDYEPEHRDARAAGYVGLVSLTAENLTQKQAAALATILQRFARTGSILPRGVGA